MKDIVAMYDKSDNSENWVLKNKQHISQQLKLQETGAVMNQVVTYADRTKVTISYKAQEPQHNHYVVETRMPGYGKHRAEYVTRESDEIVRAFVAEKLYDSMGRTVDSYTWEKKEADATLDYYEEDLAVYGRQEQMTCSTANGVLPADKQGFAQVIGLPGKKGFLYVTETFDENGRSVVVARENAQREIDPEHKIVRFVDHGFKVQVADEHDGREWRLSGNNARIVPQK